MRGTRWPGATTTGATTADATTCGTTAREGDRSGTAPGARTGAVLCRPGHVLDLELGLEPDAEPDVEPDRGPDRGPDRVPGLEADAEPDPGPAADPGPARLRTPDGKDATGASGRALALVRLHGHPLGLVGATADAPGALLPALTEAARRELAVPIGRHLAADRTRSANGHGPRAPRTSARVLHPCLAARADTLLDAPLISVVVCTHDRAGMLRDCLDSVLRVDYPRFEVVVVDNAPHSEAAARLVRERYQGRVRYLREPIAGLARARNRGLAVAAGQLIAYVDDDIVVDRAWLAAIAEAFAGSRRTGCVTGLILPVELVTDAQAAVVRHADFDKGFARRRWSLADPPPDPLFPFTAGRFGSGGNMAIRADLLRALGGFDLATGPGTPARGGEDLLAFFRVLAAGRELVYQPDAVVWHRHRRTEEALAVQAFGYGSGLGAYLTAAALHEPRLLPALLRRLPRGVALALGRARARPAADEAWSWRLSRLELQGLLYGPLGYLAAVHRAYRDNRRG
ncbi:glycosyltransferase family 2 protein [Kitasatospora sp. NPDC059722]|uniref:glycosyltransferase family 2 protein n=1 Tax=Kitasatospora sp. NPDC059722 TaxID=3346925 RepID=UPI0036C16017